MGARIDARDVLDANATTRTRFAGRIVGRFRRTGPNSWDPFESVSVDEGPVEVLPGLPVQLEEWDAVIRLRRAGAVVRVRWEPDAEEQSLVEARHGGDLRAAFAALCLTAYDDPAGVGAGAFIAGKLSR